MKIVGGILMAIGILIAGASGLCSLMVLFGSGEFAGREMWSAVLVFGGIPFAVGGGVAFAGYALIRNAARNAAVNAPPPDVGNTFE